MDSDRLAEVLTTGMVQFYRDQIERHEDLIELLELQLAQYKEEKTHLQRSFERLEDYATEADLTVQALRDVIVRLIEGTTMDEELREAIEFVSRQHNIDLDFTELEDQEIDQFIAEWEPDM